MAKKDKFSMPMGMAGITRYGEGKDEIKIKPKYIIVFSIAVVMLEVLLKVFG
jgi:preprotein translocase subunit Sec61beta